MRYRLTGISVWLVMFATSLFAQTKLATGIYQTVARSSFTLIDNTSDTLYLDSLAVCTAADFASAEMILGYADRPVISVTLTEIGKLKFAEATRNNVDKKIAIVGNGKLLSAPVVQSEIAGGMFEIAGDFSKEDAKQLAERIEKDINDSNPFGGFNKHKVEAQLSQSARMLDIALKSNDAGLLEKLLHEDLSLGHSNGWMENKEEVLLHLRSGFLVYNEIAQIGGIDVSEVANFARVRREIKVKGIADKVKFEMELKVLEVWILEFGTWKLWSRQSVQLKK